MADHTRTPAHTPMLPVTVFYSALQEFARSLHKLQTCTSSLQHENQTLQNERNGLLQQLEELRESGTRQGLIIERLNAMLSGPHTPTNRSFGAHFQPSAPCDGGPNHAPGPTSLTSHIHTGLEAMKGIYGDPCSMRKRLEREAENESVASMEEYHFHRTEQV